MKNDGLTVYTDGGSRGNPGKAAAAFVVFKNEHILESQSRYLGITTNNFAEYSGVILALDWLTSQKLITNHYSLITFLLDSELVVKQINGDYKVKDINLKVLHQKIREILKKYNKIIIFKNIPRAKNYIADSLVNKELDKRH